MKHLIILYLTFNILITAQDVKIRGRIVDADNLKPLPLANVLVENKNTGVTSGSEGEFQIPEELTRTDYIIVSYIGYKTERIQAGAFLESDRIVRLERSVIPSQTVLVTVPWEGQV